MITTSHLLLKDSYWQLSKTLVDELGFLKAGALTDLITKQDYFKSCGKLYEGRWFFYRREDIAESWKVEVDTQRKIIKEFVDLKFIEFEKKGPNPQKNYYSVNKVEIQKFIDNSLKSKNNGRCNDASIISE